MDKRKLPVPKVVYHYVEPKNEEEAKEQKRCIDQVYDLLFEEVVRNQKIEEEEKVNKV